MINHKIALIGESNVGKSSLLMRFQKGYIDECCSSTIGAAFSTQKIWLDDENAHVGMEIWDTAGQERFNSIVPMYFKDASAIILVYDVNDDRSHKALEMRWLPIVRGMFPKKRPLLVIVGNKIDLIDIEDEKYIAKIKETASKTESECLTFFTSAITGQNVPHLFEETAKVLYKRNQSPLRKSILHLESKYPTPPKEKSLSKCC